MALSEKQMNHPRFVGFSNLANELLQTALKRTRLDLPMEMEAQAGRLVDDFTALLLRAHKLSGAE